MHYAGGMHAYCLTNASVRNAAVHLFNCIPISKVMALRAAVYQLYNVNGNAGLLPEVAAVLHLLTFSFLCKRSAVTPMRRSSVL